MYKPALEVLTGVIEADDQEVEAWYLEGWCLYLMSEASKTSGQDVEGLSWQALGQDSRDCLETCTQVSNCFSDSLCVCGVRGGKLTLD